MLNTPNLDQTIKLIKLNGFMQCGHNGPYNDQETPLRNSGHWLITFYHINQNNPKEEYQDVIKTLSKYLNNKSHRPFNYSFYHRDKIGKDKCNGLIGQAWTIEALHTSYLATRNNKHLEIAKDTFLKHKFNKNIGLWHILEINGEILNIDDTLNHQLWLAYAGSLLDDKNINKEIQIFLNEIDKNLDTYKDGLIFHGIERVIRKNNRSLKNLVKILLREKELLSATRKKLRHKSAGYHSFNLYALAHLYKKYPNHKFWQSIKFKKILKYTESNTFKKELKNNKYGYPYNAPGFEMPGIIKTFKLDSNPKYWIKEQEKLTYNKESKKFNKLTNDPNTLNARYYEFLNL